MVIKKGRLKVNALVKGSKLNCYDWIHEEGLCVVNKIKDLDAEHGIYLFQVYNIDRNEWAGVANDQIIILDNSLLDLPPIMNDCDIIAGSGSSVTGLKQSKENLNDKSYKDYIVRNYFAE